MTDAQSPITADERQRFHDHEFNDADWSDCPACGFKWSPQHHDGSRHRDHADDCRFLQWLNEDDEEDQDD